MAIESENRIDGRACSGFAEWMQSAGGSLGVTTYQAGKVSLIGWNGREVSLLLRDFDKPLGLAAGGHRMALATRHEVLLFNNASLLAPDYSESQPGRYDALYLPRAAYYTGDLHTHDLAFGTEGLWLVATRFSCLAALSKDFSFVPRWQPPFISELAPEDRCHLNGLAMHEGKPKYVTALGACDTAGGWREDKAKGGVVIDVPSSEIVCRGLSMPHSPRLRQDQLWVLNSGAGELCLVDPREGKARAVCRLPGYLRGLTLIDRFALVGLSQIREKHTFGGLPIQARGEKLRCGIAVVDLERGQFVGMFEFTSGCQELYDVQFLPGVSRPMLLNQQSEATRQAFVAPEFSYWLRPESPAESAPEPAAASH